MALEIAHLMCMQGSGGYKTVLQHRIPQIGEKLSTQENTRGSQVLVAHVCNPSYLGG
jgi:hypothetical protein